MRKRTGVKGQEKDVSGEWAQGQQAGQETRPAGRHPPLSCLWAEVF